MGLSSKGKGVGALWFQGTTLDQQRRVLEGGGINVKGKDRQDLCAFYRNDFKVGRLSVL